LQENGKNVRYGFSYSFEQAGWYGIDPRQGFVALLERYDFAWARLPFFWDQVIDENGNLNLDDLEWAIEEAGKRDVKVVVAVGLKTPYYPEFHIPDYIASQVKFGERITADHPVADDVVEIDKKVVRELSRHKNISHWQVENEPFLANINNMVIDESLIRAEAQAVRESDPLGRPLIFSNAARGAYDKKYLKLLEIAQPGDVLSVNAYFKTQGVDLFALGIFGKEIHVRWPKRFTWPVQSWLFLSPDYEGIRKTAGSKGVEVWVVEMQAEPYIRVIGNAYENRFAYGADDLAKAEEFVRSKRFENIGFWGVHFWQFKEKHGDISWVKAVEKIIGNQ
jgi:hypothetical protein